MRRISALVLLSLLSLAPLSAQTASGVISGSITDTSGAAVAGAKVSLTNAETNQTRDQMTNPSGIYEFRALARGSYKLVVEMAGFKREEIIDYPGVEYVGVATFLAHAKESAIQLFL